MHRTIFADEARSKFLENTVARNQYLPETMRIFTIVRSMLRIALKAHRVRHLAGHRPDFYLDAKRSQGRHELRIELGDRLRLKLHRPRRAPARLDDQLVLDKIELNLENPVSIRNRGGSQPPRVNIKRNPPPVVDQRA